MRYNNVKFKNRSIFIYKKFNINKKEKMLETKIGKKAVSPMISTVLLIVIVIVLAIIILLWARSFVKEVITKEIAGNKKTVEQFCLEIGLKSVINDDDSFGFENTGNVPIFAYNVKLVQGGNSEIVKISDSEDGSVNPGDIVIVENPKIGRYSSYDSIKIIPIILGSVGSNTKEFECPEINGIDI